MAIKNLEAQFQSYMNTELKKLKGGFFIPTDSVTYIKFSSATASLVEALKRGTTAIILTHDPNLARYNTDAKWTTAIRRVSKTLQTPAPDGNRYLGGNLGTTKKRKLRNFLIMPKNKRKFRITGTGINKRVSLNPGVYEEKFSDAVIEFAVVADSFGQHISFPYF